MEQNKEIKDEIKYDHMHLGLKDEIQEDKVELRRVFRKIGEDNTYVSITEHQNRKYMSTLYNNLRCEIKASELRKDRSTLGNNEHASNIKAKIPDFKKFKAIQECEN